jgi:hypothetical protein
MQPARLTDMPPPEALGIRPQKLRQCQCHLLGGFFHDEVPGVEREALDLIGPAAPHLHEVRGLALRAPDRETGQRRRVPDSIRTVIGEVHTQPGPIVFALGANR